MPHSFTAQQAALGGLTQTRLRLLVGRGQLRRTRRGIYVRAEVLRPGQRRDAHLDAVRAELAARGPGFAASHLSAAAVLGWPLPLEDMPKVHLTAVEALQRSQDLPGVTIHHCDSMPTQAIVVRGVRITCAPRTVADCLRCFTPEVSVPIADAALHEGSVRMGDVLDVLGSQHSWAGHDRGVGALRLVDGRRESWLESFANVRFWDWGIERPEPQVVVLDHDGRFVARCDGGWLEDATMLELDGVSKYVLPVNGVVDVRAAVNAEKARGDGLGNLGLERVRFGLRDLVLGPRGVVDVIERRRAAGSISRFTGYFRLSDPTGHMLSSFELPGRT